MAFKFLEEANRERQALLEQAVQKGLLKRARIDRIGEPAREQPAREPPGHEEPHLRLVWVNPRNL